MFVTQTQRMTTAIAIGHRGLTIMDVYTVLLSNRIHGNPMYRKCQRFV